MESLKISNPKATPLGFVAVAAVIPDSLEPAWSYFPCDFSSSSRFHLSQRMQIDLLAKASLVDGFRKTR
jgi:hypothetical protein